MPYAVACKLPLGLLIGGITLNGSMYDRGNKDALGRPIVPEHIVHGWGITKDVPDHVAKAIPESLIGNGSIFAATDLETTINYARTHQSFNHMNGARC